uniref:Putative ankyrin n=1 Tax=Triatoma infestans TaxID=30076 RepID=A0A023EZT3_TRIIF
MNIQKLKKKKEKALSEGNLNHLFYVCKELAELYFSQEMFKEALQEYKEMERISDANNNKMDIARCNRMIGEVYCEMGDFDKALKHQKKHLKISNEEQDKVEQQRALATIGRTYFLQAESCTELQVSSKDVSLTDAKKYFLQSLSICEQLDDETVGMKQRMEMRLRLFLNLGLVLESQGQLEQAVEHLSKAIMISKKLELWEDLMRTYSALGSVYHKKHESRLALSSYDQAITVAERLSDKALHIATILVLKAEVLLELPDFLGARQALLRAYRQNISSYKSDKLEVEKKLRIVAAMCEVEQSLTNLAPDGDYEERKKLYEDLGDMATEIGSFTTALIYYHLMLECVEKCNKKREALIECYVSLAQTYKDNRQYWKALEYFKKELELEENNPSEACKTNMNIAELYTLMGDTDRTIEHYEKAKINSESAGSDQLKKVVLKCAYNALSDAKCFAKAEEIQRELVNYSHLDESESEEEEDDEEKKQFGIHINLDEISDIDGDGDDEDEKRKITRTRAKPKTNLQKRNEKGETPLHLAAISGNEILVAKLIDQGHSIDIKDYSGWTPLHEACNHGHRGVAEVLLSKGAAVNDRGGPHCDGVTPLLDAASNGSLDCIELLLSYGASPLMRTNSGESVLDCLASWRKRRLKELGVDLDDCTLAQYISIYKKIQQILEKAGQKISTKESLGQKDSSFKEGRQSRRSEHSMKHSASTQGRKSKDNINSPRLNPVEDAADEYENAMKALRFRHQHIVSPMAKPTSIPALLPSEECIGDNWLEEDLDLIRPNKKRRVCEFGGGQPQRRSSNNHAIRGETSEQLPSSAPSSPPSEDCSLSNSTDSEDVNVMLTAFKNSDEPSHRVPVPEESKDTPSTSGIFSNKLKEMNAVRRKQISLMATGVTKEKVVKTSQVPEVALQNHIQPLPTHQFTCVKVRVEGKLLLVPLPQSPSQPLTVSWLANELAIRYRSLEGIEPVLRIETQDGALLVDSDPVTLLIGMGELYGRVQSWKLPPLSTIYQEACLNGNIVSDGQVTAELDACLATNSVNLNDFYLDHKQLGPILKALSYHLPLQVLCLSGNNISDTYIKDVANCVVKLSQLKSLDLSNINITSSGLATFARIIVDNRALQRLECLYLGCNSLSDCLSSLADLLNIIPSLRTLSLPSVNLTQESFRSCPYYSLDCLERLDINFNEIGSEGVIDLLGRLNHHAIIELKMAGTGITTIREVAFFLQHFSPSMLTLLDLSYCTATDYEISELIKGIEKCQQLSRLCLDGIVGATSRSVDPLLGLSSVRELSLCGLEANQPIQVSDHLSSLAIGSCVDQAWASQRGPFGFYLGGAAVRQRTTTH